MSIHVLHFETEDNEKIMVPYHAISYIERSPKGKAILYWGLVYTRVATLKETYEQISKRFDTIRATEWE